jgi:riboflavin synthase
MFTGLVEEIGRLERIEDGGAGRCFWISATRVLEGTRPGDSVAVDGCCLTVLELGSRQLCFEAVPETLSRTTLGGRAPGEEVNLERALRLDQRLGGHLMQGHVDGIGEVTAVAGEGGGSRVTFGAPPELARFVAEKGSIAVDGVSLTIAACAGASFEVAYIPHTLRATVAGSYRPGRRVNLEVDLVARYLARLLDEVNLTGRK